MPPAKSMKVLPSTSVSERALGVIDEDRHPQRLRAATTRSLRAIQSRERGPGISVRISMDGMHRA